MEVHAMDTWMERMTTIFTALPTVWQWAMMVAGALVLFSWLCLVTALRSLMRGVHELIADVRQTADRVGGTLLEQQGELIRRVGWAVAYLEHIDKSLGYGAPPDVPVSSIAARPSVEAAARDGGNGR
jgi:hypothetical protein